MTRASESGHWYDAKTGEPMYTIVGKNGKERNTTLKDAKANGYVPSVTTIIGCADKPALVNWKVEQAIMAALTLPKIDGEADEAYIKRILADSQERAKKAREKGTQIHAWVQQGFEGLLTEEEGFRYYESAKAALLPLGNDWVCEESFAHKMGYGGKVDLHDLITVDIKTTEKPLEEVKLWDEHYMQIASYCVGLGIPLAGGICYINTETAEARYIPAEESDLLKGWKMFCGLLAYWYAKTGLKRYPTWRINGKR